MNNGGFFSSSKCARKRRAGRITKMSEINANAIPAAQSPMRTHVQKLMRTL